MYSEGGGIVEGGAASGGRIRIDGWHLARQCAHRGGEEEHQLELDLRQRTKKTKLRPVFVWPSSGRAGRWADGPMPTSRRAEAEGPSELWMSA